MAQEYRLVFLTSGQMSPVGSTGITLTCGGIMWIGEEGTFVDVAFLGHHLPTDPVFATTYDDRLATEEEIEEYQHIIDTPTPPPE